MSAPDELAWPFGHDHEGQPLPPPGCHFGPPDSFGVRGIFGDDDEPVELGSVGVDSGNLLIIDPSYLGEAFMEQLLAHRREDGSFDLAYLTPESGANGALGVIVPVGDDELYSVTQYADGTVMVG